MRYDDNVIDEIMSRNDIIDIIGERVSLSRKGANYMGLCPFHSEKTASFSVSPSKQIFKCFVCDTAGDVFSFVQKYENIDYPSAIRKVAELINYNYDFPAFMVALRALDGNTLQEKVYGFFLNRCKMSEMELYNIKAILTGDQAIFKKPSRSAVKAENGKAMFEIDPRSSGNIKGVTVDGTELQYEYSDGTLTVTANGTGLTHAVVTFEDGAQLPIVFE